jgi:hypothetical protein
MDEPGWISAPASKNVYEGAWLRSGTGEAIAWVRWSEEGSYLADCVNLILKLEREVSRYGGANPLFPHEIEPNGLVGLIRALRRSVAPQERWERDFPLEELSNEGKELENRLLEFLQHIATFRQRTRG